jgi:hypothetical protein
MKKRMIAFVFGLVVLAVLVLPTVAAADSGTIWDVIYGL